MAEMHMLPLPVTDGITLTSISTNAGWQGRSTPQGFEADTRPQRASM